MFLQIADFGLANSFRMDKCLDTFCGSPLYASPEIVRGVPYKGPEVSSFYLLSIKLCLRSRSFLFKCLLRFLSRALSLQLTRVKTLLSKFKLLSLCSVLIAATAMLRFLFAHRSPFVFVRKRYLRKVTAVEILTLCSQTLLKSF